MKQVRFPEFTTLRVTGIQEELRKVKITFKVRVPVSISADNKPLYSTEGAATFSVSVQQDIAKGLVLGQEFGVNP